MVAVSLAVGLTGASASAAPQPAVAQAQATRLYAAYFLRPPDSGGLQFWTDRLQAGMPLQTVSEFFAQSDEFKLRYGNLDTGRFVALVYQNVLMRDLDPDGWFFWVNRLTNGEFTRGGMMIGFSESPEFVAKTGTVPPTAS